MFVILVEHGEVLDSMWVMAISREVCTVLVRLSIGCVHVVALVLVFCTMVPG